MELIIKQCLTWESPIMADRVCDSCGKKKSVSGGKTCEKGHFACSSCGSGRETCPVCKKRLR